MRKFLIGSLVLAVCALCAPNASAQDRRGRQPHTGSEAVGFEVGAFVPNDDQFDSDLLINGLFEYYVRPRVSLRTEFGFTDQLIIGNKIMSPSVVKRLSLLDE